MRILIGPDVIRQRVAELAQEIARKQAGQRLICVAILKGSFVFLADLIRQLDLAVEIDFLAVASYGSGYSPGSLRILKDVEMDIGGRRVLIVEDICDTGQSLAAVRDLLLSRAPESLETCILLDKPSRRKVAFRAEYTGFEIPDEFVVGYGLDYAEQFRQLPYIAALDPEDLR